MKSHIAVIVPGGVGKEENIPCLVQLLHRLSASYVIHLYSFSSEELHPLLVEQKIYHVTSFKQIRGRKYLSLIYFVFKLIKDNSRYSFSLLQSFWISPAGWTAICANIFLKIPHVLTLPGGDTVYIPSIQYGGMRSPLHKFLIRWCCHRADQVVILTKYQESVMRMNDVIPKHLKIIPYGVEIDQFYFQQKSLSTPLQLISVGSINQVKDVFMQIKTVVLLSKKIECRLIVVGPDLMHGKLQKFAESLNIAHLIEWKGQCKHSEIPSLLSSSHMLLHTSHYEAEGVVIMEAFAAGTVVVGTHVGLLADCDINNECSIDNDSVEVLVDKILSFVRNSQHYKFLQEKNRSYAERYTIDWTAAQYKNIYQELLQTP